MNLCRLNEKQLINIDLIESIICDCDDDWEICFVSGQKVWISDDEADILSDYIFSIQTRKAKEMFPGTREVLDNLCSVRRCSCGN